MVLEDFICFKFQKRPYESYRMEVQNCGRCLCNTSQSVICLVSVGNLIYLNKRIFPPEFSIYYEIKKTWKCVYKLKLRTSERIQATVFVWNYVW